MQGLNGLVRRCCFWGLTAVLGGCSGLSDSFAVAPFLREQITGDTWRACLAREYQAQARAEVRAGRKWASAAQLAAKGSDALAGRDVPPAEPPAERPEIDQARAGLMQVREGRARNPCACATAQARFDAWVEHAASPGAADPVAARTSFEEALRDCAASR